MKKYFFLASLFLVLMTQTSCSQKTAPVQAAAQTATKDAVPSLYKAYEKYFPIGAAINPSMDLKTEERRKFAAYHYNSVTAENQFKPRFLQPKEGLWKWEGADSVANFARENNMKIRGHALVWYQSTPEWMVKDGSKPASKELLLKRMKTHIETVMNRYKKDVYCWDVVNESISEDSNKPNEIYRPNDPLFQILGEEYVAQAFIMARAVDPKAQLYYNDFRFSDPVKRKKIYDLLKRLLDKGVPIDGVGFQTHLIPDEETEAYLQESIDMFSKLGLKVQITELDVSVYKFRDPKHPDANKADDAYTDARKQKQADMFEMVMRVARRNAGTVTGVTFWGTSDARRNYRTVRIGKMDYPFIFDEFMKPKHFFNRIVDFKK
jgi:endo-1,4-beta-xylanase